jgi:hypothetical protein
MRESLTRWLELNTALYLFGQQQWEQYLLSMGEDTEHLKDVNQDVFNEIMEALRKNLDENRARFLDSVQARSERASSAREGEPPGRRSTPVGGGFAGMMRSFHRASVARGRLEMEIYDVMVEFWESITQNIRRRDIESIDPDVLNEILEQFNEDIRATMVLAQESVEEADASSAKKK